MTYEKFPYNPIRDKEPVCQTGILDLKSAMVNHTIPSDMAATTDSYNGIEDPASILGRPRDVFEALEMHGKINEACSNSESGENKSSDQ